MTDIIIGKYADVRVDFAFKKCFGSEQYKAATIGLLNAMIPGVNIRDVTFLNTELQGLSEDERKGIIDVLCTGDDGSTFIVEMQRAEQPCFRERTYFYSSLYVLNQARTGIWNFGLRPTYVVAFLDFSMERFGVEVPKGGIPMLHYTTMEHSSGKKLPGSTEFYFFDLENFVKKASELTDNQEYWLFLLRNSGQMTARPEAIQGEEFDTFLSAAEVAAFKKDERIQYEKDMVTAQDMKNALAWAEYKGIEAGKVEGEAKGIAKGKAEGLAEGETRGIAKGKAENNREVAKALLSEGVALSVISRTTGLSEQEILSLK